MEKLRFTELGLSPELLKAVDRLGFEEASPIQTAAIPPIMAGRDVIGQSSTGSGKTAAYGIPAVEKIDTHARVVQVLVLCPTRELAVQVAEEMAKLALFRRGVHAVPIFGGQSYERQFRALAAGVQIVIGTPGRVLDHLQRGTLKLDGLKMLVLDEADRMLDMGFREDIERVLTQTPAGRQILFFSATIPPPIRDLIRQFSRDPAWIKLESLAQDAPKVDQVYYEVERRSKHEVLTRLIDMHDFRYGIVFCSTKIMVDELDEHMHARGYAVERLHGDIPQAQRTRVMEKFRRRGFEFLIATDVAARGLDVDDLEVVFNFDLPNDAEDYIHRIGRTGRAGKTGRAITFVSGRELYKLQAMVRFGRLKIVRERVPSLDQVEEARENQFFEKLRATLEARAFKTQDRMVDRLLEQGYESTDIASALIHMMQGQGADSPDTPQKGPGDFPPPAPAPVFTPPPPVEKPIARPPPAKAAIVAPATPAPKTPRASAPAHSGPSAAASADRASAAPRPSRKTKEKFDRPGRTGRDPDFTTLFMNVGLDHLVTPADIVGKIAGVTRLPAGVVGAIDIHPRHTLVDVATLDLTVVLAKMNGVRLKGQVLQVAPNQAL